MTPHAQHEKYQRKISVVISVISALLLLSVGNAKAGLILQHPNYTGLNHGREA